MPNTNPKREEIRLEIVNNPTQNLSALARKYGVNASTVWQIAQNPNRKSTHGDKTMQVRELLLKNPTMPYKEIAEKAQASVHLVRQLMYKLQQNGLLKASNPRAHGDKTMQVRELLLKNPTMAHKEIAEKAQASIYLVHAQAKTLRQQGLIPQKPYESLRLRNETHKKIVKAAVLEILELNPTAGNDEITAGINKKGFSLDASTLARYRAEYGLSKGNRDPKIIRALIIKASRAAGITLEELGTAFGITRERVRQIENDTRPLLENVNAAQTDDH